MHREETIIIEYFSPYKKTLNADIYYLHTYLNRITELEGLEPISSDSIQNFVSSRLRDGDWNWNSEKNEYIEITPNWNINYSSSLDQSDFRMSTIWRAFVESMVRVANQLRALLSETKELAIQNGIRLGKIEFSNLVNSLIPAAIIGNKFFHTIFLATDEYLSTVKNHQLRYQLCTKLLSFRGTEQLLQLTNSVSGWGRVLYSTGRACMEMGNFMEAIDYLEEAKQIAIDDKGNRAFILVILADCYIQNMQYNQAESNLNSAESVYNINEDYGGIFLIYHRRAVIQEIHNQIETALGLFAKAEELIINKTISLMEKGQLYVSWGLAYLKERNWILAKEKFNLALKYFDKNPRYIIERALARNHLGVISVEEGNYNEAKDLLEVSAREFRSAGQEYGYYLAATYHNLGNYSFKNMKYLAAEEYYLKAHECYVLPQHKADADFNLAKVYLAMNNRINSEFRFRSAIEVYSLKYDTIESWSGAILEWVCLPKDDETYKIELPFLTQFCQSNNGLEMPLWTGLMKSLFFHYSGKKENSKNEFQNIHFLLNRNIDKRDKIWVCIVSYLLEREDIKSTLYSLVSKRLKISIKKIISEGKYFSNDFGMI